MKLQPLHSGKVRNIYVLDTRHLAIFTSPRISAFDVVMPTPIPVRPSVLVKTSEFWMKMVEDIIPNHLVTDHPFDIDVRMEFMKEGAVQIVEWANPLPVEAIVRGHITGSAWREYKENHTIGGWYIPYELKEAEAFPEPIFTPSTKAQVGHDENIDFETMVEILGDRNLAEYIRDVSLKIYKRAHEYASERQIIIADTKFEFGQNNNGDIILIDEVLTPDSSRFWDKNEWEVGSTPPSMDKEILRKYLRSINWDPETQPPELPPEVVREITEKYILVVQRLGI